MRNKTNGYYQKDLRMCAMRYGPKKEVQRYCIKLLCENKLKDANIQML